MNLEKHIIDTIKEWQLKIGYREGSMKLYYPGESLVDLLGVEQERLESALAIFCQEQEMRMGRIAVSGGFERYCLTIPPKGCAYVAGKVEEPEFLKRFLAVLTKPGNTVVQIRNCFAEYAKEHAVEYVEEMVENTAHDDSEHSHEHIGYAFYFADKASEEYVYWVEENEFGLTYHRFTWEEYRRLKVEEQVGQDN